MRTSLKVSFALSGIAALTAAGFVFMVMKPQSAPDGVQEALFGLFFFAVGLISSIAATVAGRWAMKDPTQKPAGNYAVILGAVLLLIYLGAIFLDIIAHILQS
jgi:hypothetical protein